MGDLVYTRGLRIPGQSALDIATNATWNDFGKDFTGNLTTQSANVLSSLLFIEVADALRITARDSIAA